MPTPIERDRSDTHPRRLIWSNSEHLFIDARLFWILLFAGSTAVIAVACLSLALQHGLPEFAVAVFIFWLALFASLAWFTRRMSRWPR